MFHRTSASLGCPGNLLEATSLLPVSVAPTFRVLILLAALISHWGLSEPLDSHPPFGYSIAEATNLLHSQEASGLFPMCGLSCHL